MIPSNLIFSPHHTDIIDVDSNEDENIQNERSIQLNNCANAYVGDGQDDLVTPIISGISNQRIDMKAGAWLKEAKLNRKKFKKKNVKSPTKLTQDIEIGKYETKALEKKSTDKRRKRYNSEISKESKTRPAGWDLKPPLPTTTANKDYPVRKLLNDKLFSPVHVVIKPI